MHSITKSYTFEASHVLSHHNGKCAKLHGHSYRLQVELMAPTLHQVGPQINMVADFTIVSAVVKKLISSHLDHHHLNDTLQTDSPTAEFIAQWCFKALRPSLPFLTSVTIHETASAFATYRPNPLNSFCFHCAHCNVDLEVQNGAGRR